MKAFGVQQPVSGEPDESSTFTLRDVVRWRETGLLTAEQETAIRDEVQRVAAGPSAGRSRRGPSLETIAMHLGGFLILFAYTVFMGREYERLNESARWLISGFSLALLLVFGLTLRRMRSETGGNLVIFAATGIVPLFVYDLQQMLGFWKGDNYAQFFDTISAHWIVIELAGIASAIAVALWLRFPPLALLASFWTWFLS